MNKIHVAVMFGGSSSEHEISIKSAINFTKLIYDDKYNISLIKITKNKKWLLLTDNYTLNISDSIFYETSSAEYVIINLSHSTFFRIDNNNNNLNAMLVDIVAPIMQGISAEDGTIQGLLESINIPYIGSGVLSSALGIHKMECKQFLRQNNINIVDSSLITLSEYRYNKENIFKQIELLLPCIIKPNCGGSSIGIEVITSMQDVDSILNKVFEFEDNLIVEKFLTNIQEIESGIFKYGDKVFISNPFIANVIKDSEYKIYSFDNKYNNLEKKSYFLDNNHKLFNIIQDSTLKIFNLLKCRDFARIDFFYLLDTGELFFNEINTMPGLSNSSALIKMWDGQFVSECFKNIINCRIEK